MVYSTSERWFDISSRPVCVLLPPIYRGLVCTTHLEENVLGKLIFLQLKRLHSIALSTSVYLFVEYDIVISSIESFAQLVKSSRNLQVIIAPDILVLQLNNLSICLAALVTFSTPVLYPSY